MSVSAAEIHATTIRKLHRNGSTASAGEEDVSDEAPEWGALGIRMRTLVSDLKLEFIPTTLFVVRSASD